MLKVFPSEKQYDKMDCGPACLKIISKYYGKYYSMQLFRERSGITKDGVTLLGLSYAAESIGFKTLSIECKVEDLDLRLQLPCIIHWQNNHFIVVYKVDQRNVYVSDPAQGLVKYPRKTFSDYWYNDNGLGFALLLEPSADFKLREAESRIERKKTFERIFRYFSPYKSAITNLLGVLLLMTILQVSLPFISRAVIDVGIRTNDLDFIHILLIGNVMLVISLALGSIIRDWIMMHIASRINTALISDYLSKIMKLPVSFFETKLFGDIIQRAQDNERIRSFIMDSSINFLFSILTFVIFSVIMFFFDKTVFFIFLTGICVYVFWVLSFIKLRKRLDWQYFELNSKNQSFWFETVSGINDIKVNNYEQKKRWKWESIQARLFHVNKRVLFINNIQSSGAQLIDSIKNLAIVFFSAQSVIEGEMTIGILISIQFMTGMLNAPIAQFIQFVVQLQYARVSLSRTNEIYQLEEEEDLAKANSVSLPDSKSIMLKNIAFQYSPVTPLILKGINLFIPEGKTTAIVGGSGSGKTTLLKLILRLYKPTAGEVLLGDMNIQNINLKQYREKFGVVLQDGKIFSDSILNNIVLDDAFIDYERVKEVIKVANLTNEIEAMPNGYKSVVGENGKGLSGGQKQRLLIARALYKNPDYLILDEATNSLDTLNEKLITETLSRSFAGKTVVVIAHRLSTIQNADQIIVMKDGFIIEIGTHQSLIARNGFYKKLVDSQNTSIQGL